MSNDCSKANDNMHVPLGRILIRATNKELCIQRKLGGLATIGSVLSAKIEVTTYGPFLKLRVDPLSNIVRNQRLPI